MGAALDAEHHGLNEEKARLDWAALSEAEAQSLIDAILHSIEILEPTLRSAGRAKRPRKSAATLLPSAGESGAATQLRKPPMRSTNAIVGEPNATANHSIAIRPFGAPRTVPVPRFTPPRPHARCERRARALEVTPQPRRPGKFI